MKLPKVRDGVGIMQFMEGYWRELIAKEIEALILKSCQVDHTKDEMQDGIEPYPCDCLENNSGYILAAAIARGEVKE